MEVATRAEFGNKLNKINNKLHFRMYLFFYESIYIQCLIKEEKNDQETVFCDVSTETVLFVTLIWKEILDTCS